jgi:phage tail protein X
VAAPNYKVAESIAIDKLIQKVYAKSPLNTAVLRKALVDANPKVITGNPQQRVKGGTSIVVPDHGEVIRAALMPFSAKAPEAIDNNPAASDHQSRKHWVRFP